MHSQHAVLEFRLHVVRFGVIRDAEAAFEPAVVTFHAMEPAALLFLLGFAFAGNGQCAAFHRHFDIVLLDFGKLDLDQVFFAVLDNVHQWRPFGHGDVFVVGGQ